MNTILIALGSVVGTYLGMSFTLWQINPKKWNYVERYFMVLLSIALYLYFNHGWT